jgi:hypothetical protein
MPERSFDRLLSLPHCVDEVGPNHRVHVSGDFEDEISEREGTHEGS